MSVRLLPLVAFSALCLLGLKLGAFLMDGGGAVTGAQTAEAQSISGKDNEGTEIENKKVSEDESLNRTGSKNEKVSEVSKNKAQRVLSQGPEIQANKSEFAVLQNLAARRRVLEKREKGLFLRENLLKAAESRVEERIAELKNIETRIRSTIKKQEELRSERFTLLVKMYSAMKPADAARLFNRLDLEVLTGLVQQMKARVVAPIMAKMNPDRAQHLTLKLANRKRKGSPEISELPKIGG